jgi:hypothetical protein
VPRRTCDARIQRIADFQQLDQLMLLIQHLKREQEQLQQASPQEQDQLKRAKLQAIQLFRKYGLGPHRCSGPMLGLLLELS